MYFGILKQCTMERKKIPLPLGIILFSIIETAIGIFTLVTISFSLILNFNTKPNNILIFVYTTSLLSFALGIGILRLNKQAYELLLFLAGVVIISKILIFTNIIQSNGSLETTISSNLKSIISISYHFILIYYLKSKKIKPLFEKH